MYQYGDSYLEFVELSDGTNVLLRPIQPSDKAVMQEGFKGLSPHSRYQRVMGQKKELTAHELRYLTEFDGVAHYDEFPGKGLGTTILDRLLRAAWERGIRHFHFELMADNAGLSSARTHREHRRHAPTPIHAPAAAALMHAKGCKRDEDRN